MKRLCAILALLGVVSIVAVGCEPSSHGRYRQMTYRRVADADLLGFQEDLDASILLTERPTHLTHWYHN